MVETKKVQDVRNRTSANSAGLNVPAKSANLRIIEDSDQSTTDGRPAKKGARIRIGVIDQHSLTRVCITRSLQDLGRNFDIMCFADCDECLRSTRNYDIILYHAHEAVTNGCNDERYASFEQLPQIAPVIILAEVESTDFLLEAFERGARGFIPTASTTPEVLIEIIDVVRAGGMFVFPGSPAPLLKSVRGINGKSVTPPAIVSHQFTPRETAVLDCLKLGKSNKIIAYELNISESTVKVHIGSIMKKMKATNRTEVVCRSL